MLSQNDLSLDDRRRDALRRKGESAQLLVTPDAVNVMSADYSNAVSQSAALTTYTSWLWLTSRLDK